MKHDTAFWRDDLRSLPFVKTGDYAVGKSFKMKDGAPPVIERYGPKRTHLYWPDIGTFENCLDLRLFPDTDFRFLPMLIMAAAAGRKGFAGRRAPRRNWFD